MVHIKVNMYLACRYVYSSNSYPYVMRNNDETLEFQETDINFAMDTSMTGEEKYEVIFYEYLLTQLMK